MSPKTIISYRNDVLTFLDDLHIHPDHFDGNGCKKMDDQWHVTSKRWKAFGDHDDQSQVKLITQFLFIGAKK
jgi:hypothetical protein